MLALARKTSSSIFGKCLPTSSCIAQLQSRGMRPVTPSPYRLASYHPLPFLRAVFQSLARAIFTDADFRESLRCFPQKSTPMDLPVVLPPVDFGRSRLPEKFWGNTSTTGRFLGGRQEYFGVKVSDVCSLNIGPFRPL